MIVKQNNQIQPWKPVRRASLIGGVTAAEVAMLIIINSEGLPWFAAALMGLGAGVIGAAVVALVAYLVSLRMGNSLGNLEHDLARAASIFERGLIDEAEYGRIKGQILESYHYTRGSRINVLGAARWGALLGLLVPLTLVLILSTHTPAYLLASLVAGAAGVALSGAGTAAVVYARQKVAQRQLGAGNHPLIDASSRPQM
jgi:hypothetical protein